MDDDTIEDYRTCMLPLGIVGSTDKMSVRFRQAVGGVPVRGGWVNAVFDMSAHLLALDSDGLPGLSGFPVDPPPGSQAGATAVATADFGALTGLPPFVVDATLIISQNLQPYRVGRLAWEIAVRAYDAYGEPAYLYTVSADPTPTILERESLILNCFQSGGVPPVPGSVTGVVTRGDPDWDADRNGTNTEILPLGHMYVRRASNGAILTTTKENGSFSIPATLTPIAVKFTHDGPFVKSCPLAGFSFGGCAMPGPIPGPFTVQAGSANDFLANPGYSELLLAQVNAFQRVNQMRDWIRDTNACDTTFDDAAPFTVRPNRTGQCDAAYDPRAQIVWFSRLNESLDCLFNRAFPTIIWHEMGHWMNDLYGHGNSLLGFGEGAADAWALYLADFERVGAIGSLQARFGTNACSFCGDCPPGVAGCTAAPPNCENPELYTDNCQGCHLDTHDDGLPLMGALWKVRTRLKATRGDDLGAAIANALFLDWMVAFTIGRIKSVIEYQWLILDDTDGVISNGTPNFGDIDGGFVEQRFPGFRSPPIRATCTPL